MELPSFRPIVIPLSEGVERRRLSTLKRDVGVIRVCAILLAVMASLTIGVAAGAFLAPTAIAVVLALILAPVSGALERIGLPAGLAAMLAVIATVGVIVAGGLAFAPSASALIKQAPQIVRSVEDKFRPITRQLAAVETASQQIARATAPTPAPGTVAVAVPVAQPGAGLVASAAEIAPDAVAKTVYVTILTIFLLAYRAHYRDQLITMPRRYSHRLRLARIARDVKLRVSGYLFTLSMINIGLALVTTACFMVAGIKQPMLWGIAFGAFNFVPVIGPTTMIIAAALFGIATAPTLFQALIPPAILLGLNTIEANVVQPLLLARRLVVSPIAIFITVATLVWMWGPPSAIVAIPALILVHTIMLHVPSLRPFALMLATVDGHRHQHVKIHQGRRASTRPLGPLTR